jgi:glycosyltransferase involved in cell wall biosynthesis
VELTVALEQRFARTPDGAVWAPAWYARPFWSRYLDVFEGVRIAARVRDVPVPPRDRERVDRDGVAVTALPAYHGPWQYLVVRRRFARAARAAAGAAEAVLLRLPGPVGGAVWAGLAPGRPYAVELTGDPYDMYAPGAVEHVVSPLMRVWLPRQLRRQCAAAAAVAYVNRSQLAKRYPASPHAYVTSYSSIDLGPEAIVDHPRAADDFASAHALVFVGLMEQFYKGQRVLLDALRRLVDGGADYRLVFVGDGRVRGETEALVRTLGLGDRVRFVGELRAGQPIRDELARSDLFVLPSLTEGLPRAMIEAMAQAVPCIGTTAGGIPDLLDAEDMVPPGDAAALARSIRDAMSSPERLARMSARNLAKAGEYRADVLRERRRALYRDLRERTERWAARGPRV